MNTENLALDDDELDRLDAMLEQFTAREEGYDVERLDGFFAALAVCPELVPPSRYLPLIRGDEETTAGTEQVKEGGLESLEQMQDFMLLLVRHANSVMGELRNAKKKTTDYVPVIFPDEVYETPEDAQEFMGISWALGFIDGMQLFEDAWDAAANDNPALERLEMLITSLLLDDDSADGNETALSLDERLDVFAELPLVLKAAAAVFAGEQQKARSAQTVVRGEKTGRNDPCTCGSGKKFKQCCGK